MKVVVIDGLIGAGKTTLIRECVIPYFTGQNLKIIEVAEPVSKWKSTGRLAQFYADPAKRAYQFQTMAFHDRVTECLKQHQAHPDADIFILERSIFTDLLFVKALLHDGIIDQTEYDDYISLWTMWEKLLPVEPDLFVYLKPGLDTCMSRLTSRSRDGETVGRDYQKRLEEYHDEFYQPVIEIKPDVKVKSLIIQTDEDFKNDQDVKNKIGQMIQNCL